MTFDWCHKKNYQNAFLFTLFLLSSLSRRTDSRWWVPPAWNIPGTAFNRLFLEHSVSKSLLIVAVIFVVVVVVRSFAQCHFSPSSSIFLSSLFFFFFFFFFKSHLSLASNSTSYMFRLFLSVLHVVVVLNFLCKFLKIVGVGRSGQNLSLTERYFLQ